MKKFLSMLIAVALIVTSTSFVFAGSGKSKSPAASTRVTTEDSISALKAQLKTVHGDKVKMKEILKKIAALKKKAKNSKVDVYVNGEEVSGTPVFKSGKALLPLKPIVKALKATYEIRKEGAVTKIIIRKDNITLTLTMGSNIILINDAATGKTVQYKVENRVECTKNGTFIPMGVIQKLLRQKIDFDKDTGSIIIEDPENSVNLALNMPVNATSTYGTGFSPIYAVDGKADTRWSSEYTTTASLTVDLGAAKNIGKVKLAWEAAYAKGYAIQVSNDNIVWNDAIVVTNGDGATDELTFGPFNARYVRVDMRERGNTAFGYSLYEFEVYSSDKAAEATINGKVEDLPGSVNLTTEGVLDWAHWGLTDTASFNHKAGVVQQIPNFSTVGAVTPVVVAGNLVNFVWTDGAPTAATAATANAVYIKGQGNGFTLTVPASLTQRTLKVYVSALDAKGKLEATLSGASAPYTGYIDSQAALKYGVFTIDFKAAAVGQSLTIKYTVDNAYDINTGVSLQAITLK